MNSNISYSQTPSLHCSVSGSIHLVLVLVPGPHLVLQLDQDVQDNQGPNQKQNKKIMGKIKTCLIIDAITKCKSLSNYGSSIKKKNNINWRNTRVVCTDF